MTLRTRPEEIYRALIEATAYGTRLIVETFEASGVPIRELVACGGLPDQSPLLMQIYSDVTGREISVAASSQTPALGAAMHGAVAAGSARGGFDAIDGAASRMGHLRQERYRPDPERTETYDRIYAEYLRLHDHFGRGGDDVMKRLKILRREQHERRLASAPADASGTPANGAAAPADKRTASAHGSGTPADGARAPADEPAAPAET
jgi:L-ribulokinase